MVLARYTYLRCRLVSSVVGAAGDERGGEGDRGRMDEGRAAEAESGECRLHNLIIIN